MVLESEYGVIVSAAEGRPQRARSNTQGGGSSHTLTREQIGTPFLRVRVVHGIPRFEHAGWNPHLYL